MSASTESLAVALLRGLTGCLFTEDIRWVAKHIEEAKAAGAAEERARIVAWLRAYEDAPDEAPHPFHSSAATPMPLDYRDVGRVADAIHRGDHMPKETT